MGSEVRKVSGQLEAWERNWWERTSWGTDPCSRRDNVLRGRTNGVSTAGGLSYPRERDEKVAQQSAEKKDYIEKVTRGTEGQRDRD